MLIFHERIRSPQAGPRRIGQGRRVSRRRRWEGRIHLPTGDLDGRRHWTRKLNANRIQDVLGSSRVHVCEMIKQWTMAATAGSRVPKSMKPEGVRPKSSTGCSDTANISPRKSGHGADQTRDLRLSLAIFLRAAIAYRPACLIRNGQPEFQLAANLLPQRRIRQEPNLIQVNAWSETICARRFPARRCDVVRLGDIGDGVTAIGGAD